MSGRGPPGPPCAPGGRAADASEVLAVSFNQDQSCLAVATTRGVKIFSLDAGLECVFEHRMGACRIAEMLFRSSLLVVVGAGETHDMSPRRLKVFNTSTRAVIADLPFPDTIAAVRLDRQKLVVVEARRATVFDLATLAAQREMATAPNERGVVAMTTDETGEFSLVALPADASLGAFGTPGRSAPRGAGGVQERTPARAGSSGAAYASDGKNQNRKNQNQNASRLGVVVVHDCLNHHAVCEIRAHRAPLAAMAFCGDGTRLATASERGTVVRVHALPAAGESDRRTFRRGVSSAVVRQLAFGAAPGGGLCLAASSEKGTVHVFELSASASPSEADAGHDAGSSDPTHTESRPSSTSRRAASSWRAVGVGAAAATAKLAGAVSARLAGVALGRDLARSAADALGAEREVATVRLPAVSEGCEAARAKAAARGGFGVAGACAVRGAAAASTSETPATRARGSARDVLDSIRVVAVNGDALLCEYSVCLTGADKSRGPVLERERCVARAAAPEERAEADDARFAENEKTNARRRSREGSPDDHAGPRGPATLDPGNPVTGVDLSASMSASMGQSLFLAKK